MQVEDISYLNNSKYPTGIRLNNPGLIKYSKYKGKIENKEKTNDTYVEFEKYHYGIRAMIEILHNYYFDFDCKTPEAILKKYFEPIRKPRNYVADICKGAGFKARFHFQWNRANINLLVSEICRKVNGGMDARVTSDLFAYAWLQVPQD